MAEFYVVQGFGYITWANTSAPFVQTGFQPFLLKFIA